MGKEQPWQHVRKEIVDVFKEGKVVAGLSAILHSIITLMKNAVTAGFKT